jgi:hypothetical protein
MRLRRVLHGHSPENDGPRSGMMSVNMVV